MLSDYGQAAAPILFLFAHQDDEFGVFDVIDSLIRRGETVVIAYLTSGSLSGMPTPIRDAESIAVLEKLGVAKQNIHFLGSKRKIPDGKLSCYLEDAFQATLHLIDKIGTPKRLYFLAWEGGHQDHDAIHLIGLAIGRQLSILDRSFQFPLYTGAGLPSIFFKLFSPLPQNGPVTESRIKWSNRFRFIAFCFTYRSQKKTWLGLFPFFLFHYLFIGTEMLQPVLLSRFREPPHSNKLLYERRGFYTYEKFVRDAEPFSKRLMPTGAIP